MPTDFEKAVADFDEKARLQQGAQHQIENQMDAERSARVIRMGSRYGIPYEIADASLDELEIETRKADFNYEDWRRHSKKFAEFAAENPYHLTVLEDDKENLTMLERAWKPISMGWDKTWADVELMEIGARRAKGREYWHEDDEERMAELRKLSDQSHDFGAENLPHKILVWTAKYLGPTLQTIEDSVEGVMIGGMAGAGTGATVGAAGGPAGIAAGAVAGFTTGMTVGGGTYAYQSSARLMTGEAYNQYIQQGFSHENAAIMAKSVAYIGAIPEVVSVGKALKYIPGVGRVTDMAGRSIAERLGKEVLEKRTVAQATKSLGLRYGEVMGTEIATEIFQTSLQTVGQNILADIEMKPEAYVTLEEWGEQVAETFIETAKGTLLIAGLGPGMQYIGDVTRAGKAERMGAVWDTVGRGAKASKLAQKAPEAFRAYVGRFAESGKVLINVGQWDRYWQDQGADPTKIAAEVGIADTDIAEARTVDGDIEIDGAQFIEKIAPTKHHDGLLADLKADPDDMSLREAEDFRKNNPEIMKSLEESLKSISEAESNEAANRIAQDVFGQLLQANVERRGAEALSQLYRGIAVIASRAGVDPDALYRQVFGGVTRVRDEALTQRPDVDLTLDPYLNMLRDKKMPSQRQMFGPTLIDFIKSKGGLLDEGGELTARDAGKEHRGLVRPQAGKSLDAMAELAAEAGYLPPDYSPNALLAALDRELAGEPVRSRYEAGDPHLQELGTMLEQLDEQLGMLGIDVDTMSNEEIRRQLANVEQFQQMNLDEMAQLLGAMDSAQAQVEGAADTIAADLAKVLSVIDVVGATVDFGNVEITDTIRVRETGEVAEMTAPAQALFDKAKQSKDNAIRLLDCLK